MQATQDSGRISLGEIKCQELRELREMGQSNKLGTG